MKKISIYLFVIFFCVNAFEAYTQKSLIHYKPINLPEGSFQWMHVLKDTMTSGIQLDRTTPYSTFAGPYKVILEDNQIIFAYESIYYYKEGTYLQKIDLETGDSKSLLIWDKRTNGGVKEIPENFVPRSNGTIDIITSRYPDTAYLPRIGVLNIDADDFTVIDHQYGDFSDTNSIELFSTITQRSTPSLTLPKGDSTYVNYQGVITPHESDPTLYRGGLRAVEVDARGHIISDTLMNYILYDINDDRSSSFNYGQNKLFHYGKDTLAHIEMTYFQEDSVYAELFYFDLNLNRIANYNVSHLFDSRTIFEEIQNWTKDYFTILAADLDDSLAFFYESKIAMVLDHQGNLVERFDLFYKDSSIMVTPLITRLSGEEGSLVISGEVDPYSLNIWTTDGVGQLRLQKTFEFDEGYFMRPVKVLELPEDKILLFVDFVRDTVRNRSRKFVVYASAVILFDREDLGFTTSTNQVASIERLRFSFTPNPVKDRLFLGFSQPFTGRIEVTGGSGNKVIEYMVDDKTDFELSVEHLPPGMYFIQAISEDKTRDLFKVEKFVKY